LCTNGKDDGFGGGARGDTKSAPQSYQKGCALNKGTNRLKKIPQQREQREEARTNQGEPRDRRRQRISKVKGLAGRGLGKKKDKWYFLRRGERGEWNKKEGDGFISKPLAAPVLEEEGQKMHSRLMEKFEGR